MSNEVHPLLSVIESWAEAAPKPLIPFAPPEEFQTSLDLSALLDHRLGHEHAKAEERKTYQRAALLGRFLVGSEFSIELHATIYHAAAGNPLAFALCDAVWDAHKLGGMAPQTFWVATHLEGFVSALEAWTRHFEYDVKFSGPDKLPFILREIVENDAPGSKYWLAACQADFPDGISFAKAFSGEHLKLEGAKRKRSERGGAKRAPSAYRDRIAWGWLPLSLWARSAAGISCLLEPESMEASKAEGRVRRDISSLKFSNSHRGDHQGIFEIGEKMMREI